MSHPSRMRTVPAVVIGAGVAGLSCALGLDSRGLGSVVVSQGRVGDAGSSPLAQGGVAAAVGPDDAPADHAADTLAVSGGLGLAEAARVLTDGGPGAIDALVALGATFDRTAEGALALGREAGHGRRRIVHANGDATGAEVMATLAAAARARPAIELYEHTTAIDLIRGGPGGRRVIGVLVLVPGGQSVALLAPVVVLATGGYGRCFARTTVPADVVGAGVAMAARAGATVADMELVQFHPTALDVTGLDGTVESDRLPLLTEALRGEGAVLMNELGQRFMVAEHPDAELAPRDVVARAIYRQLQDGHRPYLDARAAVGDAFPRRFPTVFALATGHGFDPRVEPLPVTPAAHYCMGGVAVDTAGRTSVPGLWAVGEVASSGLHGANRLASNSLLEGLVMGHRAAADAVAAGATAGGAQAWRPAEPWWVPADTVPVMAPSLGDRARGQLDEVREILWQGAGVVRSAGGLTAALAALDRLMARVGPVATVEGLSTRNAGIVARLVIEAALARTESRGAHYRADHPAIDVAQASRRMAPQEAVPVRRLTKASPAPVPSIALAS